MAKLKLRFLQSMVTPTISYRGGERDGDVESFEELEAIRLVEAEICIPMDQKKFDVAKANRVKLQEDEDKKKEIAEIITNLDSYKLELEAKELEVTALKEKITIAEAAIK